MNIREIRVDGFGALRDTTLSLEGPLTVIYGPNEAGKSTVLHLIRAVLFGFPPRGGSGGGRFEPPGGGAHGGALMLESREGERILVARRAEASGARGRSPSGGRVRIVMPDGSSGGEELLSPLLGGVTGEQFRNLFAFSLTELQELRTLTAGELGAFLYSAGLGVRASAVVDAERQLAQEMDTRYKPRGKNRSLNRMLATIGELEADLRRSRALAGRYQDMSDERDRLAAAIGMGEDRLREARGRLGFLQAASQVQERWLRREAACEELSRLPDRAAFPEEGLRRQEELLQERDRVLGRLDQLAARFAQLERLAADRPEEDAVLLADRAKLEDLLERLGAYRAALAQRAELRTELAHVEEQADKLSGSLGVYWNEERLLARGPALFHQEEAKAWQERWAEHARKRERLEAERDALLRRLSEAERAESECKAEWSAFTAELERKYPPGMREAAAKLPDELRELRREMAAGERIMHELEIAERREWELAAAGNVAVESQTAGRDAGFALTALGLGTGAAGIGLSVWFAVRGEAPMSAAAFALFAALAAAILIAGRKGRGDGAASNRASRPFRASPDDPVSQRIKQLAKERNAWADRMKRRLQGLAAFPEAAAAAAGMDPHPSHAGLPDPGLADRLEQWAAAFHDARRESERREERWRMEARTALNLRRQAEETEASLKKLSAETELMQSEWREWVSPWTGGAELTPDFVPDWFRLLEEGRHLTLRKQRLTALIRASDEETGRFRSEAVALLNGVSMPLTEAAPPTALTAPADDLPLALKQRMLETGKAAEREAAIRRAEEELAALQEEREALLQAAGRNGGKLQELWKLGEASDEESFRRHSSEEERRRLFTEEIRQTDELLAASVGLNRVGELDGLFRRYGAAELADEVRKLERECGELERTLGEYRDAKGRLGAELDKLEQSAEQADKQQRLEEACAKFREEAGLWAVSALCAGLFRRARESYERERQPGVLKQASVHFSRMTGGRYKRVMVPVGENRLLAERADGEPLDSALLSRGTAEQLYLAMRFALADEFARRTPLPLILDDIFVNFDRDRLDASAAELGLLSERHQVILFTCHPHVVEAVERQTPNHQIIRL